MKKDNKAFLAFGILNVFSFILATLVTSFASLLLMQVWDWLPNLFNSIIPAAFGIVVCVIFVPLSTCIAGIICGLLNRKQQRYGLACSILSAVGLAITILGIIGMMYVGGHA